MRRASGNPDPISEHYFRQIVMGDLNANVKGGNSADFQPVIQVVCRLVRGGIKLERQLSLSLTAYIFNSYFNLPYPSFGSTVSSASLAFYSSSKPDVTFSPRSYFSPIYVYNSLIFMFQAS